MPTRLMSDEQEREIIALYLESNASVKEIQETYHLHTGSLYSILNRHGIKRRTKEQRATAPMRKESEEKLTALPTTADLTILTDSNGFVQSVERTPAVKGPLYVWEVRFESAMRVESPNIIDAIVQVQKLPACRRVITAILKGNPSP